jgi:hypothetical protein
MLAINETPAAWDFYRHISHRGTGVVFESGQGAQAGELPL